MTDSVAIVCVPPRMFAPAFAGVTVAGVLREAVRTAGGMGDIVARIERADLQCWLVFAAGEPVAACFTDIAEKGYVGVYGLTGVGAKHWARPLMLRLADFAAAEGCSRVMFKGRKAWGRLLPECKPVGSEGAEHIYERATA